MALIPKPPFPNIPSLPGVPQLLRSAKFPPGPPPIVGIGIAAIKLFQALTSSIAWGVFKHEKPKQNAETGIETVTVVSKRIPVVQPDSIIDFGYRNEASISNYPVQEGGFASYNKVNNPFEIPLRMAKGGSKSERKKFLDAVLGIAGDLELYDIMTPERTWLSVNVLRVDITRQGMRGAAYFGEVDVFFQEIREVTATYSTTATQTQNAQDPSAQPVQNSGTVQGQSTSDTVTPESQGIQAATP